MKRHILTLCIASIALTTPCFGMTWDEIEEDPRIEKSDSENNKRHWERMLRNGGRNMGQYQRDQRLRDLETRQQWHEMTTRQDNFMRDHQDYIDRNRW